MPYIVLANQLSFQKTKDDDPRVPDGAEILVKKGERVPEWAPTFLISALDSAGLVVFAQETVPPFEVGPVPAQPRTPDQPAVLPSDPNGTAPTLGDLIGSTEDPPLDEDFDNSVGPDGTTVGHGTAANPLGPLPKTADSKDVWEQYAAHPSIGMTLGEAEAMNKTDLMAEVKRRHALASA